MAEVLEKFTFPTCGRKYKYPWETWFDGRIWKLEHPGDFKPIPRNFQCSVRCAAERLGKRVRVAVVENTLVIQAYDPE